MTAQPLLSEIQPMESETPPLQECDAFAVAEDLSPLTDPVLHRTDGSRTPASCCGCAGQASLIHPTHGRALGMECCSKHPPAVKATRAGRSTHVVQGCPACGRLLRTHMELLGELVACHHCGGEFVASDPSLRTSAGNRPVNLRRADALLALLDDANDRADANEAGPADAAPTPLQVTAELPSQSDGAQGRSVPRPSMMRRSCFPTAPSGGKRAGRPALVGSIAGQAQQA